VGQYEAVQRRLVYVLAWAIATIVTAAVSWLGLSSVLTAAAQERTGSRSIANDRLVTPTKAPAQRASSLPAAANWTQVADGRGVLVYRRTIHTTGGDVAVWCEPDAVRVLETTPKPGYAINVTRTNETEVNVSFTKDRLASRVLVRWWNGPYAELTESIG
jgi:hypothetical protein